MEVVNVKVKYIRPNYHNLKEWMGDENNVYIGRGGIVFIDGKRYPPSSSKWANPYKLKDKSREECLKYYEIYIRFQIKNNPEYYNIQELKGKKLGCWCCPEMCHGDILCKILNE